MRINFIADTAGDNNYQNLVRWIILQTEEFGKEYDVKFFSIRNHVFIDKNVSELFCSWMAVKGLLNMKPYLIRLEDGKLLAQGIEIVEDELLTLRLLNL